MDEEEEEEPSLSKREANDKELVLYSDEKSNGQTRTNSTTRKEEPKKFSTLPRGYSYNLVKKVAQENPQMNALQCIGLYVLYKQYEGQDASKK